MADSFVTDELRQTVRDEMLRRLKGFTNPSPTTPPTSPWVEPEAQEVVDKPGFLSSNLKKGYATTGTAIGGLAKFLGAEDLGQETVDYWKRKSEEYEKADPTLKLKDINGVGDVAKFVGQQTVQMAPLALMTGATGGLGGIAGRAVGLTGKALTGAMGTGAALGSIGTETGIISSDVEPGQMNRTQILKGAIPAGLLEVVPELIGFSRTGLGGKAVKYLQSKYGPEIAEQAVTAAKNGGFWKGAGKVAGDLGMVAASEGMTESAQSPLETWGAGKQVFKEGKSFTDAPFTNTLGALTGGILGGDNYTPGMKSEMLESLAAGAAGGFGMGVGGHALNKGIDILTKDRTAPQEAAVAPVTPDINTTDDLLNGPSVEEQVFNGPITSDFQTLNGRVIQPTATIQPNLFTPEDAASNFIPMHQAPVEEVQTSPEESKYLEISNSLKGKGVSDVVKLYNSLKKEDDVNKLNHPTDTQVERDAKTEALRVNDYVRQKLEQDYGTSIDQIAKEVQKRREDQASGKNLESLNTLVQPSLFSTQNIEQNSPVFESTPEAVMTPTEPTEEELLKGEEDASKDRDQLSIFDEVNEPISTVAVEEKPNSIVDEMEELPPMESRIPAGTKTTSIEATPELRTHISGLVNKLTGGNATIEFHNDAIERVDKSGKRVKLEGETLKTLMRIVQTSPRAEKVARHESIHVLRNLGVITEQEWNVLKAKAKKWAVDHNIARDYPNLKGDAFLEEAVARAFENGAEKSSVFSKIREFFEKLFNFVKGNEFQSSRQVFEKIESGEIGSRAFNPDNVVSGLSRPAIASQEFIDQLNTLAKNQGNIDKNERLNEELKVLDGDSTIKANSVKDNLNKLVKAFEPEASTKLINNVYGTLKSIGVLAPKALTKRGDTNHSVTGVFNAFKMYYTALNKFVEDFSGQANEAPLPNGFMTSSMNEDKALKTVGEFRSFFMKYKTTLGNLEKSFNSKDFNGVINALDAIDGMGFAPVQQKGNKLVEFYNRYAAIQMYTFMHYGSVSEVLFPEWYVFAQPLSRENLPKQLKSYEEYMNMMYGMDSDIKTLSNQTIKDIVGNSQLIKDVVKTMSGLDTNVYLMRSYDNTKDYNFLTNQIVRTLGEIGALRLTDTFGDQRIPTLSKKEAVRGSIEGIVQGTEGRYKAEPIGAIFAEAFKAVPKNVTFAEAAQLLAEGKVARDYEGLSASQLSDLGADSAQVGSHPAQHKDNFRIQGHPNAAEIISNINYAKAEHIFIQLGVQGEFREATAHYKAHGNREGYIKQVINLLTKGLAKQVSTSENGTIDDDIIKALESTREAKLYDADIYDPTSEDWSLTRFGKAMDKASSPLGSKTNPTGFDKRISNEDDRGEFFNMVGKIVLRDETRPGAMVPYAFALNEMADRIYKQYSGSGGQTSNKGNLLQKLAQIVTLHVKAFGEWPVYVKHDMAIESILKKAMDDSSKYGHLPVALTEKGYTLLSSDEEYRLNNILMKELGYASNSTNPVWAQIKLISGERVRDTKSEVYNLPKGVVVSRVESLINKINASFNSNIYSSDKKATKVKEVKPGAEEMALRYFFERLSNGLLAAKSTEHLTVSKLQNWSRRDFKGEIDEATKKDILKTVKSLKGKLPFVDTYKYHQAPTISLNNIFSDLKSDDKASLTAINDNYLPHINRIIRDIVGIDVSSKIVVNKDKSVSLQVFPDSTSVKVDKATYTAVDNAAANLRDMIFNNTDMPFTNISKITEWFVTGEFLDLEKRREELKRLGLSKVYQEGLDVRIKETTPSGPSERRAELDRGIAGPEQPYTGGNIKGAKSAVGIMQQEAAKIFNRLLEEYTGKTQGATSRVEKLKPIPSPTKGMEDWFVPGLEAYMDYALDGVNVDAYVKDSLVQKSDETNYIAPILGQIEVDFDVYNQLIHDFYKDMSDFMIGREGKSAQHFFRNAITKENVYTELSTDGMMGNQEIRFWNVDDTSKKSVRIMSVKDFKKMFRPLKQDEARMGKEPIEQVVNDKTYKILPDLTSILEVQEFNTALRGIDEDAKSKIEDIFFKAEGLTKEYLKSKKALANILSGLVEVTELKDVPISKLASAVNIQAFTAGDIVEAITAYERNREERGLGIKRDFPKLYAAVQKSLDALMDAGFLDQSFAEGSKKLKEGSMVGGRKYILTQRMFNLMQDKAVRAAMRNSQETQASVWQETVKPFVDNSGAFKNYMKGLRQNFPGVKESVLVSILKTFRNIFRVPFFMAQKVRELMPVVVTSSKKTGIRDFWKHEFISPVSEEMRVWEDLAKTDPEESKNLDAYTTYLDATGKTLSKQEALRMFGLKSESYDLHKKVQDKLTKAMPELMVKGGAMAYMAKFHGRFQTEGLDKLAAEYIGSRRGTLSNSQIEDIAATITPREIAKDKYWNAQFTKHLKGYNDWLGSTLANIASVKNYMPRIRKIGEWQVELKDSDNRLVGVRYFDSYNEADAWKNLGESEDSPLWDIRKPKGEVTGTIANTKTDLMGMYSTMDSKKEFKELQQDFEGDVSIEFMKPAFGNGTLSEGSGAVGSKQLERRINDLVVGYDTSDVYKNYRQAFERIAMSFARLEYGLTQFGNIAYAKEIAKTKPEISEYIAQFVDHLKYDLARITTAERTVNQFKSFTALMYMGGRIMPMLVNSLQPITTAAPAFAKLDTGPGTFAEKQARATKKLGSFIAMAGSDIITHVLPHDKSTVGTFIKNALTKSGLVSGERAAKIPETHRIALEEFSKNAQLLGMFNDMNYGNDMDDTEIQRDASRLNKLTENMLKGFSITEMINREGVFLMAFDQFYNESKNSKESYTKAWEFVNSTQYLTTKFNAPMFFKNLGPAGSAAYSLMSFPFQMINQVFNLLLDVKGGDFNSLKVIGGMLGVLFLLGGAEGLPFQDLFTYLFDKLSSTGDIRTDARRLMNTMGAPEFVSDLIMHGLPSLAGVSIAGNIGMRTPMIGGMLDGKSATESAFGASAGIIGKVVETGKAFNRDDIWGIFENGLPEALAAPTRAIHSMVDVKRNKMGKPVSFEGVPIKESLLEASAAAIGLKTIAKADRNETMKAERTLQEKVKGLREKALREYYMDGDLKPMQEYNKWRITSGLGKLAPKLDIPKEKMNKAKTEFERRRKTQTLN